MFGFKAALGISLNATFGRDIQVRKRDGYSDSGSGNLLGV